MYPAYLRLLGPDIITLEVKYTPIRPTAEANTKTIGRESIGNTSHTNKQHNKKNMKAKPANNDSRNGNIKVGMSFDWYNKTTSLTCYLVVWIYKVWKNCLNPLAK